MAYSQICFGSTDSRKGTKLIALCFMAILGVAIILAIVRFILILQYQDCFTGNPESCEDIQIFFLEINNDVFLLFILILFLYINFNLKKATQKRNLSDIKHWLIFHSMSFIFFLSYYGTISAMSNNLSSFLFGLLVNCFHSILIIMVKKFYDDEHAEQTNETISINSCTFQHTSNDQSLSSFLYGILNGQNGHHSIQPTAYSYQLQQQACQVPTIFAATVSEAQLQEYIYPPPYSP